MKWRVVRSALVAAAFLATSCSDNEVVTPKRPALEPLHTNVPIDIGTFHNEILARMEARATAPSSVSYEEFTKQIRVKANKALEPYQPNREITDEDVIAIMDLFHGLIEPYYDVTNNDSSRSEVSAVFDNLMSIGMIDSAEHEQLVALSKEVEPQLPSSQTVLTAMEIRRGSLAYWSSGRIEPLRLDEDTPTKVRNHLADWLGGMIGALIPGAGPILTGTLAAGCSLYFIVDGGSVGTGGPAGGVGDDCWCCPSVGPPCE